MKLIKLLSALLILTIVILTTCKKPEEAVKPTACFNMSKTEAAVNEQITFTNCSENAESYLWNFGDGSSSTEKNTTHAYTEDGNYTINLRVANGENYNQTTKSITIIGIPSLSTGSVSNITTTTASITGNISDFAGNTITQHGHCWSTNQAPTTNLATKTTLGARTSTGDFTSNLTNLSSSTTYYVRAYVTTSTGTVYGNEVQFTSSQSAGLPTVTTTAISAITENAAASGGNVTSDGGTSVTAKGVCWSTSSNPTVSDNLTNDGSGTGIFVSDITGLTTNTTYYVRAYATNSTGTAYGNQLEFTTLEITGLPTVTTTEISDITINSAKSGGNITSDGGTSVTAKGICWSTSPNPTISDNLTNDGSGTGTFISNITGLTLNTTYYVKAYATNSTGTGYGSDVSFTTLSSSLPDSVFSMGTFNGWNTVGLYMAPVDSNMHIGYQKFDNSSEMKILNERENLLNAWGGGSTAGTIEQGAGNIIIADQPGYDGEGEYEFMADLSNKTIQLTKVAFGVVGSALSGGWDNDVDMVYNINSKKWEGVVTFMETGKFKFRANHAWDINFGGSLNFLVSYGADIPTPGGGTYDVSLDLGGVYSFSATTTMQSVVLPTVTTTGIANITYNSADYGGDVTSDGGATVTARGVCWSTSQNPTIDTCDFTTNGTGTGSFTSNITGLSSSTTYYVRGYATNSVGTAYSNNEEFTTSAYSGDPIVTTKDITSITDNSAVSGGNIIEEGVYGIESVGVCYGTSPNPDYSGLHTTESYTSGDTEFTGTMQELSPGTTYYVRAYVMSSGMEFYGDEKTFVTTGTADPCNGISTISDYDGNYYNTISIGNQCWMQENLQTTSYADGTALVNGTSAGDITGDNTTKYYFAYDDNDGNVPIYGRLYTWAAIMNDTASSDANPSGIQGVCPTGWHVPSDAEIKELEMYLGMSQAEADATGYRGTNESSKLAGNASLWSDGALENDTEFGASGFQVLPAGHRGSTGTFHDLGGYANFWSATEYDSSDAWGRSLYYNNSGVSRGSYSKNNGFSVRCVKD